LSLGPWNYGDSAVTVIRIVSRRLPRRCWIQSGNRCSISSTIPREVRLCKMKRVSMNDTQNETVRFSMKPNPFFYALEVTLYTLLVWTAVVLSTGVPVLWPGNYSVRGAVLLLITYVLLGPVLFIVVFIAACLLMFVVTDERAIIRFSFWGMTTDRVSIAIETVKRIEINSYGATYGSIYLSYDKASSRDNSKDSEPDEPQPRPIRRVRDEATMAAVPIKRFDSIWRSVNIWRHFFGFYGFEGFDEFANIVSG
jgi:hypothetical protein